VVRHADPPHEPWGFVSEPYLEFAQAQAIVTPALTRTRGWAVQLRALLGERSAWNPPATLPIIATFDPNYFNTPGDLDQA
jgi:hypothetical protein